MKLCSLSPCCASKNVDDDWHYFDSRQTLRDGKSKAKSVMSDLNSAKDKMSGIGSIGGGIMLPHDTDLQTLGIQDHKSISGDIYKVSRPLRIDAGHHGNSDANSNSHHDHGAHNKRHINRTSLASMNLSNKNLYDFSPQVSNIRKSVKRVNLNNNNLTTIPDLWTKNNKSLTTISLSNNSLITIPTKISDFENLKTLDMSENCIKDLPASISTCMYLKTLNLSKNPLMKFPIEVSSISSLRELKASYCQLNEIPDEIQDLEYLEYLEISNNNIFELPESMDRLIKLKILDISENNLTSIPKCIQSLMNLEELNLRSNKIRKIENELTSNNSLVKLNISQNFISVIRGSLSGCDDLKHLNIADNLLTTLDIDFTVCPLLTILNISGNLLHFINNPTLEKLSILTELKASHCGLKSIPDCISEMSKLKILNVASNKIAEFQVDLLRFHPSLQIVILKSNKLRKLPENIALLDKIVELDIRDNNIDMYPMGIKDLMKSCKVKIIDEYENQLFKEYEFQAKKRLILDVNRKNHR